jgi:hypothetical protein
LITRFTLRSMKTQSSSGCHATLTITR